MPWAQDAQVEQDLIISRALIEIYFHPLLSSGLAFRGGTALYKLYLKPPARYSEDIDLVRITPGPAGPIMNALHAVLDPWLGKPTTKQTKGRITFVYRFRSEGIPPLNLRLKIEINTREHNSVIGFERIPFTVESRWYAGTCEVLTYSLDELVATKLRALYQRKKGRDLFDIGVALGHATANPKRIVATFSAYMKQDGSRVTRAMFEANIAAKLRDAQFNADIDPLLAHNYRWEMDKTARRVCDDLLVLLPGNPWKGENQLVSV